MQCNPEYCQAPGVALRKESVDRNNPANAACAPLAVALRKESVDRNDPSAVKVPEDAESLSVRRAWIEINGTDNSARKQLVALRKESVDRNRF